MPSPVGHSLAGLALAALASFRGRDPEWRRTLCRYWKPAAAGILLANLPDIDYLPGLLTGDFNAFHHVYTHSLGWILLTSAGLAALAFGLGHSRPGRWFVFPFVLQLSHLVMDMLTDDGRPPFGILFLWPFRSDHWISPQPLFMRIHKADLSELFQWANAAAVGVEILWCLPFAVLAVWWGLRRIRTG